MTQRLFGCLIVLVLFQCICAWKPALKAFKQKSAFKVIAGLNNFDEANVVDVCWAAEHGRASHVDIASKPELVSAARKVCSCYICVSSVTPQDFLPCVEAGADMLELGNFDSFYDQGITFSAEDVLDMTKETRELFPDMPLSVTVPHTLSLPEAIDLAQQLEAAGADIIQTEGKVSARTKGTADIQESMEIATPSLAAAYALSRAVDIPVMCASGLNDVTVPAAMAMGASGVGIGSMINKLSNRQQMLLATQAIADALGRDETKKDAGDITAAIGAVKAKSAAQTFAQW